MVKKQRTVGATMRPNIQISHALNGRVKDFAAEHDLNADEAYEYVIRAGLAELEGLDDLPPLRKIGDEPESE